MSCNLQIVNAFGVANRALKWNSINDKSVIQYSIVIVLSHKINNIEEFKGS